MGYVRTAGMSTAARRRRQRTALVLTTLVLLLLVVFGYATAYYQGWIGSDEDSTDTSQVTQTVPPLQPGDVSVNVYNATGRAGLAGRTAQALEARGFGVESIADDPENATIEEVGTVRFGPDGDRSALLLRESVPGLRFVPDAREGATVDLVLGDGFEELPEVPADDTATTAEPEG